MSVYPGARWEPLPTQTPPMTPTAVIVHSNAATSDDLYGWWVSNPDGLNSHFQINTQGIVYQYVDTGHQAYANMAANAYAVSIESANNPDQGSMPAFDSDPWNPAQTAALKALLDWLCTEHGIARQLVIDGEHGIGFHEQYADWTTPGHHCPGNARVHQLETEIIPSLNPKKGAFMALTDAQQLELLTAVRAMVADDPNSKTKMKPGVLARIDARTWQTKASDATMWARLRAKLGF